jgi:flagellar biosynthesis/type III secretory pathway protein FliH
MTFLLWQSQGDARLASPRLVMRADEVPLLQDAQQLCERLARLTRDAARHVQDAEREARERGHAEGREAGREAVRDEMATALQRMAEGAAAERAQLRRQVGALALQVARKMLGGLAEDALLAALAAAAARDALPAQQLTLSVHPDLCEAVRDRLAGFGADELHMEVRGDPACARDACRLESELGSVDASLDAQLARLAQAWSAAPAAMEAKA